MPLSEWMKSNPKKVGRMSNGEDEPGMLPFLLKLLTVNKALSIQAHPDIELARSLHRTFPTIYKDGNHKPELICALDHFEGLCQFRPLHEIRSFVSHVPELRDLILSTHHQSNPSSSSPTFDVDTADLKTLFALLMKSADGDVRSNAERLCKRLSSATSIVIDGIGEKERRLILRVAGDYPGDVGLFCIFFLNIITLQKGQAVFLAANEPHAYLYGNGIEIMATSDNVIRAGLTPKFKDVPTLLSMLTYNTGHPTIIEPHSITSPSSPTSPSPHVSIYAAPVKEFVLYRVLAEKTTFSLETSGYAAILFCIQGSASVTIASGNPTSIDEGDSFFLSANTTASLNCSASFLLFIASIAESKVRVW